MKENKILGSQVVIPKYPGAISVGFVRQAGNWQMLEEVDCGLYDQFPKVIDRIARGVKSLLLVMDSEPRAESYELQLLQFGNPWEGGGYYRLLSPHGKLQLSGIWLCDSLLHLWGDIPDHLYLQCPSVRHP